MKVWYSIIICSFLLAQVGNAQVKELYYTSGGEAIFSFADIEYNEATGGNIMRFAPVVNFQSLINYDFNQKFGVYTGFDIGNVGFIYDLPNSNTRKKFRTYNFGFPFAVKVGNLEKLFLFGGYSLEIPVIYKEKTFEDEVFKAKSTEVFSRKNSTLAHGVFVGVQMPYGISISFKYYLNNFFNQDYQEKIDDNYQYPYSNAKAHIFYFSLSFHLFKNTDLYYNE